MAEVQPFRAITYDANRVGKLERVISPPYDVISPEEQADLYAASEWNYVRVILNRSPDPYADSAQMLVGWLRDGILDEDGEPALYEYRQEFTNPADGRRYTRTGLFCALRLAPYESGIVLPHEETRKKAKEDRLRLMRSTAANVEPIYALYEDERGYVDRLVEAALGDRPADLEAEVGGDRHSVRRIGDPDVIRSVQQFLAPARIWIADGHHRYETALTYRNERRAREGNPAGPQQYDYLLVVLSAFNDPGLVVLPTHRLVRNVPPSRLEQLPLQLDRYFDLTPVEIPDLADRMAPESGGGEHRFGMVTADGAWTLTLRDASVMDAAVERHGSAWKELDVAILHALALERSLGIPSATLATSPDIAYTRDREEAVQLVRAGEYQVAFLLNPPHADEVRRVAAAGEKMPAKSTYFYPKLWSGLVLRKV